MNKVKAILSLCRKSDNVITGEDLCHKAIAQGRAYLVLIACDASANTRKKFLDKSSFYKVQSVVYGSKEELSKAISKNNRATFVIKDAGLARHIISAIKEENYGIE